MSLVVVWRNEEQEHPSIWIATDSRISGRGGRLLDEGGKLFSLLVVSRRPGDAGFFSVPYFAREVGLACVGGSLIYQHVYACLVPILSNLIGLEGGTPSMEDVAGAVGRVTTKYVVSLGEAAPSAHRVTLVLVGHCTHDGQQEAFAFGPTFAEDGAFDRFEPSLLDLAEGRAHFFGDCTAEAEAALAAERNRVEDERNILWHRAPTRVLRAFVDDPARPTIGGDVQLGFVLGTNFTRAVTVAPHIVGQPEACMRLNNIDLAEIGPVGPCQIGLLGMVGL